MNAKKWEKAYKEYGEIQAWVSDLVKVFVETLKKRNAKNVLDLCFGTGRHVIFLAEQGFEVFGIDISKTGKEITEKKLKEKNLKNVHLKIADMHNLPYEDVFFDGVVSVYSLEHNTLNGIKRVVSEIERVLKPKGLLIATLISTKDPRFGTGKKIELNTFTNLEDPAESGVPHHFSDEKEAEQIFNRFKLIKLEEIVGYSTRRNMKTMHWEITAEKV